jgi:hypothetical protein
MNNYSEQEIQKQVEFLRGLLKPGDTVYTILRHVSKSKMTRYIGVVIIRSDGTIYHPNYAVNVLLDKSYKHNYDGVKMEGCGMDMGFELVYQLSHILFPDGGYYALRQEWL